MESQRDKTIIGVNFTQPSNVILGAGSLNTTMQAIWQRGNYDEVIIKRIATQCHTEWDTANSGISNTLFIRFHPSLKTCSDIAKKNKSAGHVHFWMLLNINGTIVQT